jgi:hypothetical protein
MVRYSTAVVATEKSSAEMDSLQLRVVPSWKSQRGPSWAAEASSNTIGNNFEITVGEDNVIQFCSVGVSGTI